MLNSLYCLFFGCKHSNYSRVWNVIAGKRVRPYVVCLDCSKELLYDTQAMKVDRRAA